MKKKTLITALILAAMTVGVLAGCSNDTQADPQVSLSDTAPAIDGETPVTVSEETAPPETTTAATTPAETTAPDVTTTAATTTAAAVTTTWTENALPEQVMYVCVNGIHSRINAIQGSTKISRYNLNDTVTVVARTDTDYYKLSDGNFIHVSYLSNELTPITTTQPPEPENTDYLYDPNPPDMEEIKYFEQRLFELTNQEREKLGLPLLKKRDDLSVIAHQRSIDLASLYDKEHYRPNGEKWYQMLYRQDMYYGQMGENIAAGQRTPEEMIEAWMNSEIHRENITSTDYDFLGVGFYYTTDDVAPHYRYYWVQDFYGYYKGD